VSANPVLGALKTAPVEALRDKYERCLEADISALE